MGLFGFGQARNIQDLSIKNLHKERIGQEVKQDQLLARIRKAGEQFDALLESASEPGMTDGDIDAASYSMAQISKSKDRFEKDLQAVMTRITVIDSIRDVKNQKEELEKKGIWKKINEIPEEQLENQLLELSTDRKESQVNLSRIVEVFDVDRQAVRSQRSADVLKSRKEILQKLAQKSGDDGPSVSSTEESSSGDKTLNLKKEDQTLPL
jgi:hypothetical protein